VAFELRQRLDLDAYLPAHDDTQGWGERWFQDAAAEPYYLLDDGRLFRWGGAADPEGNALEAELDPLYYEDPERLLTVDPAEEPTAVVFIGFDAP
jgi:hypothetical protein